MTIDIKSILRAGTALQATALVGNNLKAAKDALKDMKKKKSSSNGAKRLIKTATGNIIGIPLIQVQSQMINDI